MTTALLERSKSLLSRRITFRINEELQEELNKIIYNFNKEGLEVDESKIIRYLLNKGIEKIKEEKFQGGKL